MVTATPISVDIRRGDAWSGMTFNLTAPVGEGASYWDNPVIVCQLRRHLHAPTVDHTWSEFGPVVTTNGEGRGVLTFSIVLSPEETAGLQPGQYVADVEVASDSFPKSTVVDITARVHADVTR